MYMTVAVRFLMLHYEQDMLLSVSGFKTNKTELNAVFDIFERENRDFIEYQEFIEAMKKKRHVSIFIII